MSHSLSQEAFLAQVASRNPHQPEFIQAVSEVVASIRGSHKEVEIN